MRVRHGGAVAAAPRAAAALLAVALLILSAAGAAAQALPLPTSAEDKPPVLGALTSAELAELLGRLTDAEARALLADKLAEETAAAAAAEAQPPLFDRMEQTGAEIRERLVALLSLTPRLTEIGPLIHARLEPTGGLIGALAPLAAALAAGLLARTLWRRRIARKQAELAARHADRGAFASPIIILDALRFLVLELLGAAAFYVGAGFVAHLLADGPELRLLMFETIAAITNVLIAHACLVVAFPREWAVYRLLPFDDRLTDEFRVWVLLVAGIWAFGFSFVDVTARYGLPAELAQLQIFYTSTVFLLVILLGVVGRRRSIAAALGGDPLDGPAPAPGLGTRLANNWHVFVGGYVALVWAVAMSNVLLIGLSPDTGRIAVSSLLLFVGVIALDLILERFLTAQFGERRILAQSIRRALRILLLAGAIVVFLSLWGVTPEAIRSIGVEGRLLNAATDVAVTALIGYSVWRVVYAFVDARLADETPHESDEATQGDGEGGAGLSRTATLLPLLRSAAFVIIFLFCVFSAAGSLGLNVAALLAGAGVVGIAVGFGAQTLVRDIVSGIFFLVDDAFRQGEYVDVGAVKGTVEKISLRSFRLRHHLGYLHTVPFGEIQTLTNFSRDWVIMKLPLRLTFETDPQLVKRLVKRIGAEMMEDPLLAPKLLAPPKSQGVIQMEDTAQILRVKFTAVPGEQFVLRRELLHRIRKTFEAEGVQLAPREVAIRTTDGAPPTPEQTAAAAAALQAQQNQAPTPLPDR